MAAPKQMLYQVEDVTDSLMHSLGDVQTTMASLHSSVGELINSMAEILKSMAEMKESLQHTTPAPTTESHVTVDQNPPPAAPEEQPVLADQKMSRYIKLKKLKVEMPVFNGSNVNHWILLAERYLNLGIFTETDKIRLAYMSVDGPALIWFNFEEDREPFLDWNDFKSRLVNRFGGLDPRSAMERLLALKQEDSVIKYLEQFEELTLHLSGPDRSELFLEAVFLKGLKEEIREMLRLFDPKGIHNIIQKARRVENSSFVQLLKSKSSTN